MAYNLPLTSLKSQTLDPQLNVPPVGLVLRMFTSWKNPSTSAGFEPANLGSLGEHVTPRTTEADNLKISAKCFSYQPMYIFEPWMEVNWTGWIDEQWNCTKKKLKVRKLRVLVELNLGVKKYSREKQTEGKKYSSIRLHVCLVRFVYALK